MGREVSRVPKDGQHPRDPIAIFPLTWPRGRSRTPAEKIRFDSPFRKPYEGAYDAVVDELNRFARKHGVTDAQIATNAPLRCDGLPVVSAAKRVRDAGAAVYFTRDGKTYALACDTYGELRTNLAAIAKKLAGIRFDLRDGVKTTEDALQGYLALPAPQPEPAWHEVLGVRPNASADAIDRAFTTKAATLHPDVPGGSHEAFIQLTRARAQATMHLSEHAAAHRAASEHRVGATRIG